MIEYSIIIPIYNNKEGIQLLFEKLSAFFLERKAEFIFVDDHSSDDSWSELVRLKNQFEFIKILRLSKNVGQHAATVCGINESSGNFVLTMDDDLVVEPVEFQKLIDYQKVNTYKVVYGEYPSNSGIFTKLLKNVYKSLSRVEGKNRGRGSSFRLIDGDLGRTMAKNHSNFIFIDEILLWYTAEIGFVNVNKNSEQLIKSRYTTRSLFKSTLGLIMYSTDFPLRLITTIGILMSSINFLIGAFILYKKFVHKITEQGYASLIVSILFSTGLIILSIGVISIYLRKMMRNQNNEPLYFISDKKC